MGSFYAVERSFTAVFHWSRPEDLRSCFHRHWLAFKFLQDPDNYPQSNERNREEYDPTLMMQPPRKERRIHIHPES